ncbi:VOC family protein [Actinoplanes sp. HUAS TT8]|uniref:VOC family protein n=1 Tax=Actinoplanes sp. HUAS TT8 TaxID=3447453 RepID=UPI003F51FEF5
MTTNPIRHITVDAHDPIKVAKFWAELTGYTFDDESDSTEAFIASPFEQSPGMLFIAVPEDKTVKNRVHLDIQPPTGTRDQFVERMQALGASIHEDHRTPDGKGWVTMRDPEGNEFCVERSTAERAA